MAGRGVEHRAIFLVRRILPTRSQPPDMPHDAVRGANQPAHHADMPSPNARSLGVSSLPWQTGKRSLSKASFDGLNLRDGRVHRLVVKAGAVPSVHPIEVALGNLDACRVSIVHGQHEAPPANKVKAGLALHCGQISVLLQHHGCPQQPAILHPVLLAWTQCGPEVPATSLEQQAPDDGDESARNLDMLEAVMNG